MLALHVVLWETRTMESNPMFEEVWRIKDKGAREAGDDIRRLCQSTRQWAAEHSRPVSVARGGHELRRLAAEVWRGCHGGVLRSVKGEGYGARQSLFQSGTGD